MPLVTMLHWNVAAPISSLMMKWLDRFREIKTAEGRGLVGFALASPRGFSIYIHTGTHLWPPGKHAFAVASWRPGISDVTPLSGISGPSFDSPLLSHLFFFLLFLPGPLALSVSSFFLFFVCVCDWPIFDFLFVLVMLYLLYSKEMIVGRWYVQLAAVWHQYLLFCICAYGPKPFYFVHCTCLYIFCILCSALCPRFG